MEDIREATPQAETEISFDGWDEPAETVEEEQPTAENKEETKEEEPTGEPVEEEAKEEPQEEEPQEEEPQEDAFDWASVDIKYLHENKKLGEMEPEEVKTLIQKGLNHDRVQTKLEPFKELADLYNIDMEKMVDMLMSDYFKAEAGKNGTTEEFERKQYNLDKRAANEKLKEQEQKEAKAKEESEKATKEKMYADFIEEYPDVDTKSIPQEVWKDVKNGSDLTDAYRKYELSQVKKEMTKLKKQLENKKSSPVKSTTKYGSDTGKGVDPMFAGWDD